jgi:hypothetical protein
MKLIRFTQAKARGGDTQVYVNPEQVAAVLDEHHDPENGWDSENRSIIVLNTGERIKVRSYAQETSVRLEKDP